MGNGTDLTPSIAAFRYGLPGTAGLGLDEEVVRSRDWQEHSYKEDFHFPDGNASVARMLVRKMIRVRLFWNGGFGMSHSGKGSSHLTRLRWRPLTGTTLPSA